MKEEVITQLIEVMKEKPLIDEVILYGSRAKGNYKPGSDIDLVLKGERLNLEALNKISLALDNLPLPYTFDLAIYHHIDNPNLIEHIERVGIKIYGKESNYHGVR